MHEHPLVGGIEAGGTKIVCAAGTGPGDLSRAVFPSGSDPAAALFAVTDWFREEETRRGPLHAIGIGWPVVHFSRGHQLTTLLQTRDQNRVEVGAGGINSGGVTSGA